MAAARSRARCASAPPSTGRHRAAHTPHRRPRARAAPGRVRSGRPRNWPPRPGRSATAGGRGIVRLAGTVRASGTSTLSASPGPKASTGTRQLASDTGRAGPGRGHRNSRAPGASGPDEFRRGQRAAAGRGQLQGQFVVDGLAVRVACASGRPGASGQHVGELGGLAGERMRPRQADAGRRGAAVVPDRGGSSGSSAHRQSAPCAQIPWITRMKCSRSRLRPR